MADTNQDKRTQLIEFIKSNFSIVDTTLITKIESEVDAILSNDKQASRTKTFRLPIDLLAWLENKATDNSRSPNAELIELLRNAKASA